MRGINEEILKELIEKATLDGNDLLTTVYTQLLNRYCQELQEPWIPLEEFLKSGFEGLCWVILKDKTVDDAYFNCGKFFGNSSMEDIHDTNCITRVQPIHKPEPPR